VLRAADSSFAAVEAKANILLVFEQAVGCVSLEVIPNLLGGIEFGSILGKPLNL